MRVIFPTQKTAYKGTKAKLYCRYNINLLLADIIMRWYTYGKKKFNFFTVCLFELISIKIEFFFTIIELIPNEFS